MVEPARQIDVRARILTEATRLFAERGVAGTSLQAIVDAVGITKPTLVYHFGSKLGLRREVESDLIGHWRDALPRLMLVASAGGPRLDALLHALFSYFLEDRNRARLLIRMALDDPAGLQALLRDHLQPFTRLLTEAIRAGQSQGTLQPGVDPESYALVVINSAIGTLAMGERIAALMSPEPTIEQQLHELVRIARTALLLPRTSTSEVP